MLKLFLKSNEMINTKLKVVRERKEKQSGAYLEYIKLG